MKEHIKTVLVGLISFPATLFIYLVYIHVVSLIDPILSIIFTLGFIMVILATLFWLIRGLSEFVVSIFKENKEKDEKGFKKHF